MNTSWVFLLEHLKKKKRIVLVKFSRPTQRLLNPDHNKVLFIYLLDDHYKVKIVIYFI